MTKQVGLPSAEEQQQRMLTNLIGIQNAQTMEGYRRSQESMNQLVPRTMPDGSTVMLPQSHVATFDASMARIMAHPDTQVNAAQQYANAAGAAIAAGRDPATDPQTQQWLKVVQAAQKPAPDSAAQQASDYMAILAKAQASSPMPAGALTDSRVMQKWLNTVPGLSPQERQQAVAYLATKTTPPVGATNIVLKNEDQTVPVYDTKNNNSLAYLTKAQVNAGNAAQPGRYTSAGIATNEQKPGYAFDPQTNQWLLTTSSEAGQNGLQYFSPVGPKQIEDDRQLNNRLADVQQKINRYEHEATKPLSLSDASTLSAMLSEDKFKLGAFGMEIPVDFINKFVGAARDRNLSPDGVKRIVAYFNARESMVGYQRVLSGSGRSSEKAMQLNLDTLPDPLKSPQYAAEALSQFKENLKIAAQGLPRIPGVKSPADIEKEMQQPQGNAIQIPSVGLGTTETIQPKPPSSTGGNFVRSVLGMRGVRTK